MLKEIQLRLWVWGDWAQTLLFLLVVLQGCL